MSDGNEAQVRIMIDNVAEAAAANAILKYKAARLENPEPSIPAPLKWAGGILAAILTISASGGFIWMVTTVNTMQVTLARMDERQVSQSDQQEARFAEINRRLTRLEQIAESAQ